jgi:hypothetical protein
MNRTPPVFKASKALTGFLQHKAAEALSPRTLDVWEIIVLSRHWLTIKIAQRGVVEPRAKNHNMVEWAENRGSEM